MEQIVSFLPLAILILVFYFLVFRPQQQQRKKHAAMIADLKRGDKIIANGGFVCEVIKQDDKFLIVMLGENQVKLAKDFVAYKVEELLEQEEDTKSIEDSKSKNDKK